MLLTGRGLKHLIHRKRSPFPKGEGKSGRIQQMLYVCLFCHSEWSVSEMKNPLFLLGCMRFFDYAQNDKKGL